MLSLGVLAVVCVAGWLALRGPSSAREKLADWVDVDDCASVDNQSWPATRFYEVQAGFAAAAVERAAIICNNAGPSTYYFRFRDTSAMRAALAAYPSMRRHHLCRLATAVFTTDALDPPMPAQFCERLHGVLLPAG